AVEGLVAGAEAARLGADAQGGEVEERRVGHAVAGRQALVGRGEEVDLERKSEIDPERERLDEPLEVERSLLRVLELLVDRAGESVDHCDDRAAHPRQNVPAKAGVARIPVAAQLVAQMLLADLARELPAERARRLRLRGGQDEAGLGVQADAERPRRIGEVVDVGLGLRARRVERLKPGEVRVADRGAGGELPVSVDDAPGVGDRGIDARARPGLADRDLEVAQLLEQVAGARLAEQLVVEVLARGLGRSAGERADRQELDRLVGRLRERAPGGESEDQKTGPGERRRAGAPLASSERPAGSDPFSTLHGMHHSRAYRNLRADPARLLSRFDSDPMRRSRRLLLALLLAALAAEALYVPLARRLLASPAFAARLSRNPDRFRIRWREAWSSTPDWIIARGLELSGQTPTSRWQIRADEASGAIDLPSLLGRTLRFSTVRARGVDVRVEHLPREGTPLTAGQPAIPGFARRIPRRPPARSDRSAAEKAWTIALPDVRIEEVRELWIERFRTRGLARAEGGFRLAIGRFFELFDSRLALDRATTSVAGLPALGEIEGVVEARIDPLVPGRDSGWRSLSFTSGRARLAGRLASISFLETFLPRAPW